ncbi:hypothetical protein ASD11_08670 [Aeromicrobium sp. Root495]|uniref:metal ABC transporter solute-binding protein, Zn/Mn family n=1 Tax=Aeromicrobium sp. Root495 TaxID=1736550 RepID=UPI0006FC5352|nr:zinc ABC transporter substrate-binding protein [Aeromicrobium sp. Root495]KQY59614.1 hypothetical protein ASD11_08670 [Aeromicrobium sp. Root495]
MNLRAPLALAVPLALLLSACGSGEADNGKLSVDANFYPYAWVVEQVGGDLVDVSNLTSPGVEPHDLELKPKQVASVQTADLVVFQKGFQSAVDDAVERADRPRDTTLDVSSVVTLASEEEHGVEEGLEEHDDEGHDEEGHDHEHEDGLDPHVWLDPANMVAVTKAVGGLLVKADPDHAATYRANATKLEQELTTLDASFTAGLKTCKRDTVVTSHAAFGYLAAKYGLQQVPIAGLDPSNEPSGSQLADITDLVKKDGITTVFTEELVSPKVAQTVAQATGASTATLDPIEGATDGRSYLQIMQRNLDALKKANDCS